MSIFHRPNNPLDSFWHRKLGPTLGAVVLFLLEVIQIAVISAAIIVPIRYYLIIPFYVKGASMEPNFYDHEYLIVDELTYRMRDPERGEIVVFRYEKGTKDFFIKRVIGLPGETVEISDGKVVVYNEMYPNGFALDETYLGDVETYWQRKSLTLGADQYFVMGDNRTASLDSRSEAVGAVERGQIVGRVWLRGLPISRFSLFDNPEYSSVSN